MMFKNVGIFVPKEMLINTCVEMPIGFTDITSSTVWFEIRIYYIKSWTYDLKSDFLL